MDGPITDPLQGHYPEVIDTYLEYGIMKCIAFNRRGTLLAAGCSDGRCVVWDFQTKGIAKELENNDCVAAITSVCWSKSGHHILVSAADRSLTLWNVSKGEKVFHTIVQQTPLQACLHPGGGGCSSPPSLCLVSPSSSAPFILDFNTQITTVLPISSPDNVTHNNISDGSAHSTPTAACFNKSGDLVYLGNSIGELLIIDHKNNKVCGIVQIPDGAVIKNIVFSRNGQHLLTNSSDRVIRVYENLLPLKDPLKSFEANENSEMEKLKSVGLKCLSLFREFQDSINKVPWKAPCFGGDSEWVVGGSASKGEHKLYIWDRDGLLVKLLEGPKDALVDLAWHPARPIVVSVSLTGLVYIWAKDYIENWSAFAPDYRELNENEEYVEQEDEFDLMPETQKVKGSCLNEDEDVDIITVEKDSTFSDSDISQEELCYLPAHPCPDVSEKLLESNNIGSPLSNDSSKTEVVENSLVVYTAETRDAVVENSLAVCTATAETLDAVVENSLVVCTATAETHDAVVENSVVVYTGGKHDAVVENSVVEYTGGTRDSVVENPVVEYTGGTHDSVVENPMVEYTGGALLKRKRKRSKKLLELQDLKDKQKTIASDCSYKEIFSTPDGDLSMTKLKKTKSTYKRQKRSMVWHHFKKFRKQNKKAVAVCNYCSKSFVAGDAESNTGTSNLRHHLRRKHAELVDSKQCSYIDIVSTDEESMTEYEEVRPATQRKDEKSMIEYEKVSPVTQRKDEKSMIEYEEVRPVAQRNEEKSMTEYEEVRPATQRKDEKSMTEHYIVSSATQRKDNKSMTERDAVRPKIQKKMRSKVWNYYKKITKPNNESVADCNFCHRKFVSGPAGTNHLWNHLKRKHAKDVEIVVSTRKE